MVKMIINKYLLPNGNVLLWIPNRREDNIDNVLILAGGEVLLLKSINHINMLYSYVRSDIKTLPFNELVKKYKLEGYEDIYYDLIKELREGNYPKYDKNNAYDYALFILNYLPRDKDCLLMIKKECEKLIEEIENKRK